MTIFTIFVVSKRVFKSENKCSRHIAYVFLDWEVDWKKLFQFPHKNPKFLKMMISLMGESFFLTTPPPFPTYFFKCFLSSYQTSYREQVCEEKILLCLFHRKKKLFNKVYQLKNQPIVQVMRVILLNHFCSETYSIWNSAIYYVYCTVYF
jgi:hypothetical protein